MKQLSKKLNLMIVGAAVILSCFPFSILAAEADVIQLETERFFDRYLSGHSYSVEIRQVMRAKKGSKAHMPGFLSDSELQNPVKFLKMTLFVESDTLGFDKNKLTQMLVLRLKPFGVRKIELKVERHSFPVLASKLNEQDTMKKEVAEIRTQIATQRPPTIQVNVPKSEPTIQVNVPKQTLTLGDLGAETFKLVGGLLIAALMIVIGAWLVLRAVSQTFTQSLASRLIPLFEEATQALTGIGSSTSARLGNTNVSEKSIVSNSGHASNFIDTIEQLGRQIENHGDGYKLVVQGVLRSNNYAGLFLLSCAADQTQRLAIKELLTKEQSDLYEQFVQNEAHLLLSDFSRLSEATHELIRVTWLSEQSSDLLARMQLETDFMSLSPEQRIEFSSQLSPSEVRALAENLRLEEMIRVGTTDQKLISLFVQALQEEKLKSSKIESVLIKLRPFLAKEERSNASKVFQIVASMPSSFEKEYKSATMDRPMESLQKNFNIALDLISDTTVEDVAEILACFDDLTRRKFINSMPEIKSRRVVARIPKQPTERGMVLKGKFILDVGQRAKEIAAGAAGPNESVGIEKAS